MDNLTEVQYDIVSVINILALLVICVRLSYNIISCDEGLYQEYLAPTVNLNDYAVESLNGIF